MFRSYKVLEVIWLYNNNFEQEYCGTFKTLKKAKNYVRNHIKEWENDLQKYAETGIGIEIETWEKDSKEQDDSFEELVDTYTEWCKNKCLN